MKKIIFVLFTIFCSSSFGLFGFDKVLNSLRGAQNSPLGQATDLVGNAYGGKAYKARKAQAEQHARTAKIAHDVAAGQNHTTLVAAGDQLAQQRLGSQYADTKQQAQFGHQIYNVATGRVPHPSPIQHQAHPNVSASGPEQATSQSMQGMQGTQGIRAIMQKLELDLESQKVVMSVVQGEAQPEAILEHAGTKVDHVLKQADESNLTAKMLIQKYKSIQEGKISQPAFFAAFAPYVGMSVEFKHVVGLYALYVHITDRAQMQEFFDEIAYQAYLYPLFTVLLSGKHTNLSYVSDIFTAYDTGEQNVKNVFTALSEVFEGDEKLTKLSLAILAFKAYIKKDISIDDAMPQLEAVAQSAPELSKHLESVVLYTQYKSNQLAFDQFVMSLQKNIPENDTVSLLSLYMASFSASAQQQTSSLTQATPHGQQTNQLAFAQPPTNQPAQQLGRTDSAQSSFPPAGIQPAQPPMTFPQAGRFNQMPQQQQPLGVYHQPSIGQGPAPFPGKQAAQGAHGPTQQSPYFHAASPLQSSGQDLQQHDYQQPQSYGHRYYPPPSIGQGPAPFPGKQAAQGAHGPTQQSPYFHAAPPLQSSGQGLQQHDYQQPQSYGSHYGYPQESYPQQNYGYPQEQYPQQDYGYPQEQYYPQQDYGHPQEQGYPQMAAYQR